MPDYKLTLSIQGVNQSSTTRTYYGTFADDAAARTAATDLITDFNAATDCGITAELAVSLGTFGAVGAKYAFENAQGTVLLDNASNYPLNLPAPNDALFSGNNLIFTAGSAWANFTANFASGVWTVSDGNHILATVKGKRVIFGSGKTNLQ